MAIIRKGNTHSLAMQIWVSCPCHPTKKYAKELQHVMSGGVLMVKIRNIVRETELTYSWIVVLTTDKYVAFVNREECAVLTGQVRGFFVTVHFSLPFLV